MLWTQWTDWGDSCTYLEQVLSFGAQSWPFFIAFRGSPITVKQCGTVTKHVGVVPSMAVPSRYHSMFAMVSKMLGVVPSVLGIAICTVG